MPGRWPPTGSVPWTSPCPEPTGGLVRGRSPDCGACDSRRKLRTAAPTQPSAHCPEPDTYRELHRCWNVAPSSAAAGWVDWDIFQHGQRAAHSARGENKRVGWEAASELFGQRPQAQVAGGAKDNHSGTHSGPGWAQAPTQPSFHPALSGGGNRDPGVGAAWPQTFSEPSTVKWG